MRRLSASVCASRQREAASISSVILSGTVVDCCERAEVTQCMSTERLEACLRFPVIARSTRSSHARSAETWTYHRRKLGWRQQ